MDLVFRVDGDDVIGSGHVMRCLALADALRARGERTRWLTARLSPSLEALVRSRGHPVDRIAGALVANGESGPVLAHAGWLPSGQAADAEACLRFVDPEPPHWIVVDHYAIDHRWETPMRRCGAQLMVIDDLADRSHDCDLLLDQNLLANVATRYDGLIPARATRLLGPEYALLRPEFAALRSRAVARTFDPEVTRLLVMFGAADTAGSTAATLDALARIGFRGKTVVVVGALNALGEAQARQRGLDLEWHRSPGSVAELMLTVDAAIGAPGVTSCERMAMCLPSLVVSAAPNQRPLGRDMDAMGVHRYVGEQSELDASIFAGELRRFLLDRALRSSQRERMRDVCDGHGVDRTVGRLMALATVES